MPCSRWTATLLLLIAGVLFVPALPGQARSDAPLAEPCGQSWHTRPVDALDQPDPTDCVFCGGNIAKHRQRMSFLLRTEVDGLARAMLVR